MHNKLRHYLVPIVSCELLDSIQCVISESIMIAKQVSLCLFLDVGCVKKASFRSRLPLPPHRNLTVRPKQIRKKKRMEKC